MDFNNKITSEPFTELETPVSSTKPHLAYSPLIQNLGSQLSVWYQNMKGAMMTTINGKLVELNSASSDEFADPFPSVEQLATSQEQALENLQISVYYLESRINELENNTNTLKKLYQKLETMEKQTSQKILAIAIIGAMGLTSLGVWIGFSNQSDVTARNAANYTETKTEQNR